MRKWLMILMAGLLTLSMAACSGEEAENKFEGMSGSEMVQQAIKEQEENKQDVADKAIVGSWQKGDIIWKFNADGTGKVFFGTTEETDSGSDFYFTAEDGALLVEQTDSEMDVEYSIEGDKLTIVGKDGTSVYTKIK
ncbi:MAG: hypothetical protein IJN82_06325 [Clostridia bacterium]|nr:hypothetical protein [Clostridia bacterium]